MPTAGGSSNGRTTGFGPVNLGPSPNPPAVSESNNPLIYGKEDYKI